MGNGRLIQVTLSLAVVALLPGAAVQGQRTVKPVLHGRHWVTITGKLLAATAGAMTFGRGGNAVDAACAMLAATCTMWSRSAIRGEDYGIAW